jgi:HK97 family phage portal protein
MTLANRIRHILGFGKTTPQWTVTPDEALRNPVVWACIRYLSNTIAQLPWSVMLDTGSGKERMNAHPVDRLLHARPCPEYGSFNWRQTMVGHALLHGNAYAEIERDLRGIPIALWPLHPDRVCPRRAVDQSLVYEVWNRGGNTVLPSSDVYHLRGFGDGPLGLNVVEYAAQSIGWAQATELFGANYFGEGMNPSGIIEAAQGMSPEGMDKLRTEAELLYKGPRGKRTMILDAGMKFTKLSTTPDDSQFIETMQHQVEQICRWFGVPPHKVMHLLRATFSNIEHQSIEVVIDAVTPWVKALEEEADYKLFGNNRQGYYTKIDLRGLLRGDNKSRGDFYQTLAGLGWSFNEICALEDRNGIGSDGDRRFRSVQLQPIDAPASAAGAPAATDPSSRDAPRAEWPIAPSQLRN